MSKYKGTASNAFETEINTLRYPLSPIGQFKASLQFSKTGYFFYFGLCIYADRFSFLNRANFLTFLIKLFNYNCLRLSYFRNAEMFEQNTKPAYSSKTICHEMIWNWTLRFESVNLSFSNLTVLFIHNSRYFTRFFINVLFLCILSVPRLKYIEFLSIYSFK